MGAKPLQPGTRGQRCTAVRGLRLTRSEAAQVDAAAEAAGETFSSYARQALVRELNHASLRSYLTTVASNLHAAARRRLEQAELEERSGGSGVWGLEEAALLRRLGDALLAAAGDPLEDDDPEEIS